MEEARFQYAIKSEKYKALLKEGTHHRRRAWTT
jgi:hypothetical protein